MSWEVECVCRFIEWVSLYSSASVCIARRIVVHVEFPVRAHQDYFCL
jgi:hypothetical protein